jgi:hypothetical protein
MVPPLPRQKKNLAMIDTKYYDCLIKGEAWDDMNRKYVPMDREDLLPSALHEAKEAVTEAWWLNPSGTVNCFGKPDHATLLEMRRVVRLAFNSWYEKKDALKAEHYLSLFWSI